MRNLRARVVRALLGFSACALAAFATPGIAYAAPFLPSADFSTSSNPNAPWSYGYTTTLGGSFSLFSDFSAILGSGLSGWNNPAISALSIANNSSAADIPVGGSALPPGYIWFHPGGAGEYAVLRWTSPVTGTVDAAGLFQGLDTFPTTTDVHVLLNNVSQFDSFINAFGATSPFDLTRSVAVGDTIDFVVGFGSNLNNIGDPTGLTGSISLVPEPSTLLLLTVGIAGLFFYKRRESAFRGAVEG